MNLAGVKSIAPDLTPMCEITVTKQTGRTLIHLINTTGCFDNSFFAPVPLSDIALSCELPEGCTVKAFNGGCAEITAEGVIRLDKLNTYEVIAVEES